MRDQNDGRRHSQEGGLQEAGSELASLHIQALHGCRGPGMVTESFLYVADENFINAGAVIMKAATRPSALLGPRLAGTSVSNAQAFGLSSGLWMWQTGNGNSSSFDILTASPFHTTQLKNEVWN